MVNTVVEKTVILNVVVGGCHVHGRNVKEVRLAVKAEGGLTNLTYIYLYN